MARVELQKGSQPALRKMAEDIIAAQSREMRQMRAWRKQWYGSTSASMRSRHGSSTPHSMSGGH